MCLVALALGMSARFPVVLASNRDEYFDRATAPLDWWTPAGCDRRVLGGRDLAAGGTWLGLEPGGRFALVTNVRDPGRNDPRARSRGELVTRWLCDGADFARFWRTLDAAAYNGFNLVAADLRGGAWTWGSNAGTVESHALLPGVYGLSNAGLDTPWPKVTRLKARLAAAVQAHAHDGATVDALGADLFDALLDPTQADDRDLPATGVSLALERQLSSAFIRTPDGRYGTRCSTLVIQERVGAKVLTHLLERSHDPDTRGSTQRSVTLDDWPAARA